MKAVGEKSVCVVAWDYQMARIADMAGVDIVSVGDTVGVNLWGQPNPLQITMEEILVVAKAVRRGGLDSRPRRLRWWSLARRSDPYGDCRHRLFGGQCGQRS